eukprot:2234509-Rhodomonas_salina.1
MSTLIEHLLRVIITIISFSMRYPCGTNVIGKYYGTVGVFRISTPRTEFYPHAPHPRAIAPSCDRPYPKSTRLRVLSVTMGAGASSSRIEQLQRQIAAEAALKKARWFTFSGPELCGAFFQNQDDEVVLSDPETVAILKQQVQECL